MNGHHEASENPSLDRQGGCPALHAQVMAKQFQVIRICSAYPSFTKREALVAVLGGVDK